MSSVPFHIGIDYGARLSGNTALVHNRDGALACLRCAPKEDADAFLERSVVALSETAGSALTSAALPPIFIDAPLSLPRVFAQSPDKASGSIDADSDWFYRAGDRVLGAMSPMFLGGLTARAMKLAWRWRQQGYAVYETWPRALVRELKLEGYRAKGADVPQHILERYAEKLHVPTPLLSLKDGHELDAVLAWASGQRFLSGQSLAFGEADEGMIHV
jgi:predicted nuclease with RNAse H fold